MDEQVFLPSEEKGFTSFYKRSLFLIAWRPRLRKIGIGLLMLVDLLLVGRAAYAFFDYGINDFFAERAMVGSIVDGLDRFHQISLRHAAQSLTASSVSIFALDEERADFYAELSNPNSDWQATFQYYFAYADSSTEPMAGFILPGETQKPLVALAVKTGSIPRAASLTITDMNWVRVNHHAVSDYPSWAEDRLAFSYSDVDYDANVEIEGATIGRSTFTITNTGAFGYWSPLFTIVLYRNEKVVGVTSAALTRFAGGESRALSINWFGNPPQANAVKIVPNIDIFDPAGYMPLRGQVQPDVRERIFDR